MAEATAREPAPARRSAGWFVRDAEGGRLADTFLVSAIVTILVIRAVLALTGYPYLGAGRIHIAHIMWGGLGLTVALLLLLLSLDRRAKSAAALIGGVGFGFFIDELGKFLTLDNDYFYQPAIALMYLVFVGLFLGTRRLLGHGALGTDENLANALSLAKEMALEDLDSEEKTRAESHLDRCDPGDPRVVLVRGFLEQLTPISPPPPAWYARLKHDANARVERLLRHRLFPRALALVFIAQALIAIVWTVITGRALWQSWRDPLTQVHLGLGFVDWARLVSTAASMVLVIGGVTQLRRNRLRAYLRFRTSVLIAIFVTQFFVFYRAQFEGLFGLAFNLALLGSLQFLLSREEARRG